jgi:hypothetical protein
MAVHIWRDGGLVGSLRIAVYFCVRIQRQIPINPVRVKINQSTHNVPTFFATRPHDYYFLAVATIGRDIYI